MSAAEQLHLPFDEIDMKLNASERDAHEHQTAIMGLAEKLDYINPAIYIGEAKVTEAYHASLRHSWLVEADKYFNQGDYITSLYWLKQVYDNVKHSLDQTHLTDIETLKEECYRHMKSRGKSAVASTVELSAI